MKTTGQKILMLREEKNYKQSDLAQIVGITEASLSRYENDKRMPTGEILKKLAQALDTSIDFLLNNSSDNNSLTEKEILDIEKSAEEMIKAIETSDSLQFCGNVADEEDKEYLKAAYQKFLMDVRVYNKQKYTPKKYK